MSKKFKFTKDDLDSMILEALEEDTAKENKSKPNIFQRLISEAQLKATE